MSVLGRRAGGAARSLRGSPAVTIPVVVALAVGVGVGVPLLGMVRSGFARSFLATAPFLREGGRSTDWLARWTPARQTIQDVQGDALRAIFAVLLALTLLLLVIALIDLLTLLLARAAARRPEIALRAVLGGVRWRIARPLLAEALVLVGAGSVLGLLTGLGVAVVLERSWPGETPPWGALSLDGWVLAAPAALFLALLLAWLSPLTVAGRRDLRRFLTTGRSSTPAPGEVFTRQTLAVLQIAASLVLLTTAGLLLRGFASSPHGSGSPGFDPRDMLTAQIRLPERNGSATRDRQLAYEGLHRKIAALPGVVDTSMATPGAWLGLGTTDRVTAVCPECWLGTMIKPVSDGVARLHAVTPGFFRALGVPVLRGRELEAADQVRPAKVAVISDTFAYRLFPNGEPLGKRVQIGGRDGEWYEVVGIVDDIRAPGIGSRSELVPALYVSALQHPPAVLELAVRTRGDPMRLLAPIGDAIRTRLPEAELSGANTMEAYLARFRAPLRWFAVLFGVLAAVASVLAASGLHAVMSYNVTRRTREIGIRMAIGARTTDITRMVVGESLRLTALGATLGALAAVPLGRLLQLLLSGVDLFDPVVFGGIGALLASVALLASYRPARRAAAADPQISLRAD